MGRNSRFYTSKYTSAATQTGSESRIEDDQPAVIDLRTKPVHTHSLDKRKHFNQKVSFLNGITITPDFELHVLPLRRGHFVYNPARDDEIIPTSDDVFLAIEVEVHLPLHHREMLGGLRVKVRWDFETGFFLRNRTTRKTKRK